MLPDIEDQSPTSQQEMGDDNTLKAFSRKFILKALQYLAYALSVTFYSALATHPITIIARSGVINHDSIAKGGVAFLFSLPFVAMVLFSLPRKTTTGLADVKDVSRSPCESAICPMGRIYNQSRHRRTAFQRALTTSSGLLARVGLLLLVWLALTVRVPRLKRLTLLGSPLWTWSLLAVTLTAGYFQALAIYQIPSAAFVLTMSIFERPKLGRRVSMPHEYYYLGLCPTTTMVMHLGMVLLAWQLYFSTESGLMHDSVPHPEAFEYVTWTLVSLLVGSILCFCKTLFILRWSADVVYRRFQPRILITTFKYVYLGLIVGKFFARGLITELEVLEEYARRSDPTRLNFTNYIMSKDLSISYLQRVGHILTSLATAVRTQQKDGVPIIVEFLQKIEHLGDKCDPEKLMELLMCNDIYVREGTFLEQLCRFIFYAPKRLFIGITERNFRGSAVVPLMTIVREIPNDPEYISPLEYRNNIANVLYGIVREQECSFADNKLSRITLDDFKKWMVDAHVNCVNMGRTLADANAMVTRLDIFISFIIFFVVVLLWLLITGLATTAVLVTIATPLLALTFVFGDSAKTFFQGIVFCFATHAFDVGDRCILDETELEVKNIKILTTTFVKLGTMEKRTYPNSVLATKAIVNLGWQPDPSDVVELTLDSSTTSTALQELEAKIQGFFSDPAQKGHFNESHEVIMIETGGTKKVTIQFTHVLNVNEMTHGQCMHKKNKQRSIFLKKINQFLDPKSPTAPENGHGRGSMNTTSSQVGPILTTHIRRARSWS